MPVAKEKSSLNAHVRANYPKKGVKRNSRLEEIFAADCRRCGLTPVREYRFSPSRGFRADFAWPDVRLLVEIDGGTWTRGRHNRGAGYTKDCAKGNHAVVLGFRTLHFTGAMVRNGTALRVTKLALGIV
jgi:very-short-patch-repair endonuclease